MAWPERERCLILLVEDNPTDAALMLQALERHGQLRTKRVPDGETALRWLEEQAEAGRRAPDLLLLDLRLPGISGLELLKRLKAHPRHHDIPTLVLTTSKSHEDLTRAYALGAESYVVKPDHGHALERFVEKIACTFEEGAASA